MNIYDDMNSLIANLKKDSIVIEFQEINREINKEENKELLNKMQEFQAVNLEINSLQMRGINPDEDLINKSKNIYEELSRNELATKYFEKELKLTNLISGLNTTFIKEVSKLYEV